MKEVNQKQRKFQKIYLELKNEIQMRLCIYLRNSRINKSETKKLLKK